MTTTTVSKERMLIDGKWVESVTGEYFQIENPAHRGSVIAEVPRATAEDVDIAVNAANKAFEEWRNVPARERGKLLWKIADAVEEQFDDIAKTIATETGNALRTQAKGEAKGVSDVIRYFGEKRYLWTINCLHIRSESRTESLEGLFHGTHRFNWLH